MGTKSHWKHTKNLGLFYNTVVPRYKIVHLSQPHSFKENFSVIFQSIFSVPCSIASHITLKCCTVCKQNFLPTNPTMSMKCSTPSKTAAEAPKRHRKMLSIAQKVGHQDTLNKNRSYTAKGHHYRINKSSVCYKKEENNWTFYEGLNFVFKQEKKCENVNVCQWKVYKMCSEGL